MPDPKQLHSFLKRTQTWLQKSMDEGDQEGTDYYEGLMDRGGDLAERLAGKATATGQPQHQPLGMTGLGNTTAPQGPADSPGSPYAQTNYQDPASAGNTGFPPLGRVGMVSQQQRDPSNPFNVPSGEQQAQQTPTNSPVLQARQAPPQGDPSMQQDVLQLNQQSGGLTVDLEQETAPNPYLKPAQQKVTPEQSRAMFDMMEGGSVPPGKPQEQVGSVQKWTDAITGGLSEEREKLLTPPIPFLTDRERRDAMRSAASGVSKVGDFLNPQVAKGAPYNAAINKQMKRVQAELDASKKVTVPGGGSVVGTAEGEIPGSTSGEPETMPSRYEIDHSFRDRISQMGVSGMSQEQQTKNTAEFDRKAEFERRVREEYGDKPSALMEIIGLLLGGARGLEAMGRKKAAYQQGRAAIGKEMRTAQHQKGQNDIRLQLQQMRDKVDEKIAFGSLRSKAVNARMLPHLSRAKSISGEIQRIQGQIPAPEPNDPRLLQLRKQMAEEYDEAIRIEAAANSGILPLDNARE